MNFIEISNTFYTIRELWFKIDENLKSVSASFDENGMKSLEEICNKLKLKTEYIDISSLCSNDTQNIEKQAWTKKNYTIILSNDTDSNGTIYLDNLIEENDKNFAYASAIVCYFIYLESKEDKPIYASEYFKNTEKPYYNGYVINPYFTFQKEEATPISSKDDFVIESLSYMLLVPFWVFNEYDEKLVKIYLAEYKKNKDVAVKQLEKHNKDVICKICEKYKISINTFYKAKSIHELLNRFQFLMH